MAEELTVTDVSSHSRLGAGRPRSAQQALEYIRPAIQMDGGDIVLTGVEGGKVDFQMVGASGGCPLSMMTSRQDRAHPHRSGPRCHRGERNLKYLVLGT